MPASPWATVGEDLFDALFQHLERNEKLLAKARLVNRHWRQLVDTSVSAIEPRQRVTEPNLSQLLRRFTGLTSVNVGEPWRMRLTDESVPALLVSPPPFQRSPNTVAFGSLTQTTLEPTLFGCGPLPGMCVTQGLTRLQSLDVTPLLSNDGLQRLAPLAGKLTALQYAGHAAGRSGGLSDSAAQFIGQVCLHNASGPR